MAVERRTIELNGSHGEGGGALIRTALCMSALTSQPVRIWSVRGAMRKSGLTAEDMALIECLAISTNARVEGAELGGEEITFSPRREPKALRQNIDLSAFDKGRVAGSSVIVLEALVPVLARAGSLSTLTLIGETHCQGALSYDAFERSAVPAHLRQGIGVMPALVRAGIGRGGKGEIRCEIEPSVIESLDWERPGEAVRSGVVLTSSGVDEKQAESIAAAAQSEMEQMGFVPQVDLVPAHAGDAGAGLTIWVECESGAGSATAVTDRGMKLEDLADSAVGRIKEWLKSGASVDEHLADQLVLAAAFADGRTVLTTPLVTRRLITMSWVIKQFLPIKITILGREGEAGQITVER